MNSLYLGIAICAALAGCATTHWHGNMMNNNQLMSATCDQLALEERKVVDNTQYLSDSATSIGISAMVMAAVGSGSNATAAANSSDQLSKQSAELGNRRALIGQLQVKRGCR